MGGLTCIVCHANRLTSGFKIRSTFISRCHIQSIFQSILLTHKDTTYSPSMLYLQGFSKDPSGYDKDPQLFLRILQGYAVPLRIFLGILQDNKDPQGFLRIIQDYAECSRIFLRILEGFPYKDPSKRIFTRITCKHSLQLYRKFHIISRILLAEKKNLSPQHSSSRKMLSSHVLYISICYIF